MTIFALVGASGLLLVAGCSASQKSASGGGGQAVRPEKAATSQSAAGGVGVGTAGTTKSAPAPSRALVKTADMTVRVANVEMQAQSAIQIARSHGGDVLADERAGSADHSSAQLTLEVAPASFSEVLDRLARLGEPVSRKSATDDVTQQVADVNSRLESMRASLDRVRALYAKAVSISDVIGIESEVAKREADYESLQAQQRGLTKQAAHSIVHLQLVAKQVVVAHARKHSAGVLDKFGRGWDAFVATARWTLGAIGTVLPFLVLFGGIGLVALWLRRRHASAPSSPPVQS
ncbi:MAG TPA: DUF4349 domain-containing protein [Jatrophihabitantaceae bacterium]|nr:DUF4349 domain-containing protein [Jatrophihabitantaceae bacterium]